MYVQWAKDHATNIKPEDWGRPTGLLWGLGRSNAEDAEKVVSGDEKRGLFNPTDESFAKSKQFQRDLAVIRENNRHVMQVMRVSIVMAF